MDRAISRGDPSGLLVSCLTLPSLPLEVNLNAVSDLDACSDETTGYIELSVSTSSGTRQRNK